MTTHNSGYNAKNAGAVGLVQFVFVYIFITFTNFYILLLLYCLADGLVIDFVRFSNCGIKVLRCQKETKHTICVT